MIFVNRETKAARLEICKACKHFKPETSSCGTIRLLSPLGDKVKKGKGFVRLCGCVMQAKVAFKTAKCPIDKWSQEIDKELLKELAELVEMAERNGRLTGTEARGLVDLFNKTFKADKKYTSCGPCMREIIKEAKQALKEAENS